MNKKRILILGATGMLGHTLFYHFSKENSYDVYATEIDRHSFENFFTPEMSSNIITGVDVFNIEAVKSLIVQLKPDIVVNCIGIIKQLKESKNSIISIAINSLFPHQLAESCSDNNARLIHISTDCVFNGKRGGYLESDFADADDLYGRSKYLGEVHYGNAVTLRTSIIGHELKGRLSLVDWFMSQHGEIRGFTEAIYTGFPTIEFASIIDEYVIPNPDLNGLYHVSSEPISKFDLLNLIAEIYKKDIVIHPDDSLKIDRSLNSEIFRSKTGYNPPSWKTLIHKMYEDYVERRQLYC